MAFSTYHRTVLISVISVCLSHCVRAEVAVTRHFLYGNTSLQYLGLV